MDFSYNRSQLNRVLVIVLGGLGALVGSVTAFGDTIPVRQAKILDDVRSRVALPWRQAGESDGWSLARAKKCGQEPSHQAIERHQRVVQLLGELDGRSVEGGNALDYMSAFARGLQMKFECPQETGFSDGFETTYAERCGVVPDSLLLEANRILGTGSYLQGYSQGAAVAATVSCLSKVELDPIESTY